MKPEPRPTALEIEMLADSRMVDAAAKAGKDKCVKIGCPTMIEPSRNRTGFCSFHEPRSVRP